MFRSWTPLRRWMGLIALIGPLIAVPLLSAPPAAAQTESTLTVAWVESGSLLVWREGDAFPRRIASGAVIQPYLAPDGSAVAYLRGPDGDPRSLWIADVAGNTERQLVDAAALDAGRRIARVVWAPDARTIYFSTRVGEGLAARSADDLWRVDPTVGAPERLLADGAGGEIVSAPDGSRLALASAGEYGASGADGAVAFYAVATGERTVALTFPAVATGSETAWRPALRWLPDSSGIRTAIPLPDLIYAPYTPSVTLWWLPVDGEAQPVGAVDADFFGLPEFSADGAWISFVGQRASAQETAITLQLAAFDGSGAAPFAEGEIGGLRVLGWLPGAARFAYTTAPGTVWIGGPGGTPLPFPAGDASVVQITWVSADRAVFSASQTGQITLDVVDLGAAQPLTIATPAAYPSFDAVQP